MSRDSISIEATANEHLKSFEFPGNVRELKNVVEQLSVLSDDSQINAEQIYARRHDIAGGATIT